MEYFADTKIRMSLNQRNLAVGYPGGVPHSWATTASIALLGVTGREMRCISLFRVLLTVQAKYRVKVSPVLIGSAISSAFSAETGFMTPSASDVIVWPLGAAI